MIPWDWIAGSLSLAALPLLGRKHWSGWAVTLLAQVGWWGMIISTRQWGLVPLEIAYTLMPAYYLWKWRQG